MVYGIDDTMPERISQYRDQGYVVHFMTGIAWGEYQDYLEGGVSGVGIFMSDSGLFQQTFPDRIVTGESIEGRLRGIMRKNSGNAVDEWQERNLMEEIREDVSMMNDFVQSPAFPQFFGMALPLLKYGLPVRPVQLDNVRRFAGYLDDSRFLILSYEYIKPEVPDVNASLVSWVRKGGTLLYIGDGSDPFHKITSWWRQSGYENPAQHLFEMADMERAPKDGSYPVGRGKILVWNMLPARLCLDCQGAFGSWPVAVTVIRSMNLMIWTQGRFQRHLFV